MSAPMEQSATPDVIELENGNIKKTILRQGEGECPPDLSHVFVHYVGTLLDGTEFDSSRKRNEPFKFKIGQGQVIKGWDVGVATMKPGEIAVFEIAPHYAYGAKGSPPTIPPNATLKFEVELISWDNTTKVTDDRGVLKRIVKVGEGHNRPNDNATVTIKYKGRVKSTGHVFEDHSNEPITLQLGDMNIVYGLEESVKNMYEKEHAIFTCTSDYAFGEKGDEKLNIPPNAEIEYDVEMIKFEKGKETWDMNNEERIQHMITLKEQGNTLFKKGQFKRAQKKYSQCTKVFQYDKQLNDDERSRVNAIKVAAFSNMAVIKSKDNNWNEVIEITKDALEIDGNHVKCLYRRGQAYLKQGMWNEADADLTKAHSLDATNREVLIAYNEVKKQLKKIVEKEKRAYGGWFGKITLVTKEEEAAEKKREQEQKAKEAAMDSDDSDVEEDATVEDQQQLAEEMNDAPEAEAAPAPLDASA